MTEARNPIKTVQVALDIIDVLKARGPVGVTALANATGITKGTAHSHLATLREYGYVVKTDEKYMLGLRFVDIAHHARTSRDLYDIATDAIDELAAESGELALFTVEEQGEGICLYNARGDHAVQTELYDGYRDSLYHTAVGKAILAFKPESARERIVAETELTPLTENTITDVDRLHTELETVRENGFAYNREETLSGLAGIGTPVVNQGGQLVGAVSVIGTTSLLEQERRADIQSLITHTANVIEVNATSI